MQQVTNKMNIKILDCTLRDGGYINDWNFGSETIKKIIHNLAKSKIDYIECGFKTNKISNNNKSLFSSFEELEKYLPVTETDSSFTLMINYGEVEINQIKKCNKNNYTIRVAFKKENKDEALEFCEQIKNLGYKIFINPMHTNIYSQEEFKEIINKANKINPKALTIVDTTGSMKEDDVKFFFENIDKNLNKNIALCFHSHNNLQLSFSNAQCLMKICKDRELIIDSTVFGMGRGAGNLCTELLTQYINDNYNGDYNIIPILKIIDEEINPIFAKTPWGYSVPYYLAATNHCHPNYAKFLADKQTVPVEIINNLLKAVPKEKKSTYDQKLIKQIYLDNFSNIVDDSKTVEKIKNILQNRKILALAPGANILKEKEIIKTFIEKYNPYIISLNFTHENFNEDMAFVTNLKRFNSLSECKNMLVVTSNIENSHTENILNYTSYINDSKIFDNVTLILLKLLKKIGVKEINFAGLDGFSEKPAENYATDSLLSTKEIKQIKCTNKLLKENIALYKQDMSINFITTTLLD